MDTNARYNFPKQQVAAQIQGWDSFVIVGKLNGETHLLSSDDQRATQDTLREVAQLEPASG